MNDLFSASSFRKYTDLKEQVRLDDMESGAAGNDPGKETINLERFFEDVEAVKEDIKGLEKIYKQLQDVNEETKTAHNANMMKNLRARMDKDIEQVLRNAKMVKGKLEALDKSNAANRKIPGCGPGSSADRTRTSVVGGLGKKLKDVMNDFQGLRANIAAEYKETVGRRYFTVTGKQADDDTIETLIATGESENFLQKAIQDQGRGQVMDAIMEIQERHDAVKDIEKSLMDLHQVFLDMAALVESQGQQLNDIESHVAHASSFVRRGTVELEVAKEHQSSSRKWFCIAVMLVILLVVILVFPLLINLGVLRL